MTQLSINTSQNVEINFTAASIGERILAFLIDVLIQGAYLILIFAVLLGNLGFWDYTRQMDYWSQSAVQILFYLPVFFYPFYMEALFEGQTLGKKLLRIKVVKIDGYQASVGDYFIRWIFRIIDVDFMIVGLMAIILTEKSQRVGDMVAGTAVISLKNDVSISSTILMEVSDAYKPVYPLVIKLSDNDLRIIKETFQLAIKNRDIQTLERLASKIESVTGIKNSSGSREAFIQTVLLDYNFYTQGM